MAENDAVLERLFARYRVAVRNARAPRADLATIDAVLEMRVVLYEHLVQHGWDPPAPVRRQLELDALLMEQPPSLIPA